MADYKLIWALLPLLIFAGCRSDHQAAADVEAFPPSPTHFVVVPSKSASISVNASNSVAAHSTNYNTAAHSATNFPTPAASTNTLAVPSSAKLDPPPTTVIHTNRVEPVETWVPLEHWSQANGFGPLKHVITGEGPGFSFGSKDGTMEVAIGSRIASWRGTELHLAFAPQLIKGHPFVHILDIRKNFMPLLDYSLPPSPHHVIVLDPGHGGNDNGAKSIEGHFEKEYTLDLARRLKPLLTAEGWTVKLTRTSDISLPLVNRILFADDQKADFFLSLHFNSASPDQQESGLETYCIPAAGMPSNLTRGYKDATAMVFPNNRFDSENLERAMRLHRAILHVNGHLDRGVRRARFLTVLREQNRPAVLIEGGFLSNPAESRRIADPAYRQRLAEAIAGALKFAPETPDSQAKPVSAAK